MRKQMGTLYFGTNLSQDEICFDNFRAAKRICAVSLEHRAPSALIAVNEEKKEK